MKNVGGMGYFFPPPTFGCLQKLLGGVIPSSYYQ